MVKLKDIAWLGGLLEGEGCFGFSEKKYPNISVGMTAEDTITKVADMWDVRIHKSRNCWKTQINGAYAISWMMTLYPFLGRCRKDTITEIIKFWRNFSHIRAHNGLQRTYIMATCHPDRVSVGFGLCSSCYMKEYRKRKRLLKVI
ncbi:hypothetical protein LCGC14_1280670 [marine sediment metagenome]|uniref:Homing endonuclease LAGLIDADG domain-containing protein n=1 Tax=marine sediment metagenome TaxID=412755 RepID=A0A0F9KX05_9ZZZZ